MLLTKLLELLSGWSPDVHVYAYEGERTGIVLTQNGEQIEFIECPDERNDNAQRS